MCLSFFYLSDSKIFRKFKGDQEIVYRYIIWETYVSHMLTWPSAFQSIAVFPPFVFVLLYLIFSPASVW